MASGPITSWQIDGETMEIVTDFIFLGSKITADSNGSHEIKRRLLLGRKVMINPEDQMNEVETGNLSHKELIVFRILFPLFPHLFAMK